MLNYISQTAACLLLWFGVSNINYVIVGYIQEQKSGLFNFLFLCTFTGVSDLVFTTLPQKTLDCSLTSHYRNRRRDDEAMKSYQDVAPALSLTSLVLFRETSI